MEKKSGYTQQALYGYSIGDNIQYRLSPALLINTLSGVSLRLRPTMARLLQYILSNAGIRIIEDKDIMIHVFENYGLKCNKQRLWHSINTLKTALLKCGFTRPLFYRVNKSGFIISGVEIGVLMHYSISDIGIILPMECHDQKEALIKTR